MSDHRPTTGKGNDAARLLASARARMSAVLADLALAEPLRLTEWHRATLSALLAKLVATVEDELRTGLADALTGDGTNPLHAALLSSSVAIALPILDRSLAFPDASLAPILLRRVEEHRLHRAANGENGLLLALVADENEGVAGEAMAILIARSARLDAFQEPIMARNELGAELQHDLVWTIAAAMRRYLVDHHDVPADRADTALAAAASRLLAGYDEGATLDTLSLRLARRLEAAARLDDNFIGGALGEGNLPFFLACLATRAGLGLDAAWEIASDPEGRGTVLLLRAASVGRETAGAILLRLREDEEVVASLLGLFDGTTPEQAESALGLWRIDPAYRSALALLSSSP